MSGRIPRCHLVVPYSDKAEIGAYDTANNTGFGLAAMRSVNGRAGLIFSHVDYASARLHVTEFFENFSHFLVACRLRALILLPSRILNPIKIRLAAPAVSSAICTA